MCFVDSNDYRILLQITHKTKKLKFIFKINIMLCDVLFVISFPNYICTIGFSFRCKRNISQFCRESN